MGGGREQRFAAQDRLFAALERLESKETQHAAFEELQRLVRDVDPANLSTLLHAAGTATAKTTLFARVHCLRLAAMATQQAHCAAWLAMLEPPLLPKLLGLLTRTLHDADSAVRAAAAEGFGTVAEQMLVAHPQGCELTAGDVHNPVLSCILDALSEPGGAVQAGAAAALAAAADHLRPGLDPALLSQLLRVLSNPLFLGRAELCGAVARLEGGRVQGLVASSCQQLVAAMPEVLGAAADGTGLLGALASKGKDFQLRAAAAHALKALAVGVGPLCTAAAAWQGVSAGLKAAKTDVSKPVREAALAALPVVSGLLDFLASGAPAVAWPEACGALLGQGSGVRRSPATKGKAAPGSRPGGAEEPSAGQQIAAAWPAATPAPAALVPAAQGYGLLLLPPGAAEPGMAPALPLAAPGGAAGNLGAALQPLYMGAAPMAGPAVMPPVCCMPVPGAAAAAAPGTAGTASQDVLGAQLAAIQEQQAQMAAALSAFTSSTHGTLKQLQRQLASVSAGFAALASGPPAYGQQHRHQAALLHQQLQAVSTGMAALEVGVAGAQHLPGQQALAPAPPSSASQQQATASAAGAGNRQRVTAERAGTRASSSSGKPSAGAGEAVQPAAPASQPRRLSSLHRSFDALEQQCVQQGMGMARQDAPDRQAQKARVQFVLPAAGAPVSSAPAPAPAGPASQTGCTPASQGLSSPTSLDSTHAQLLRGGMPLDDQRTLRLLRCMARTGPVWEHLSAGTAQELMRAVCGMLQEGIALKRLLPCLWPLADTSSAAAAATAAFPPALRHQLLSALAAYRLPTTNNTEGDSNNNKEAAGSSAVTDGSAEAAANPQGAGLGQAAAAVALQEKRDLLVSALRAVWDA